MSFTSKIKEEITKVPKIKAEKISELSAIIRNNGAIGDTIKITTENDSLARYLYKIIKEIYDVSVKVMVRKGYNFHKNYIYLLEIKKNINEILDDLGILKEQNYKNIPPEYILGDEEMIGAYLSGLFLACGSINDPKTSRYHLEFLVDEEEYADFLSQLLSRLHLGSKVLKRENKYMIYIKEAEKIGDYLRHIKAVKAVLYFEEIRIYRSRKNMVNRLNNCEQANVDKMISTSFMQVQDIELLKKSGTFDLLDEKLKEVCIYRLKYKDVSLSELSDIISLETGNSITKSGLHHRFKKISDLASKVRGSI